MDRMYHSFTARACLIWLMAGVFFPFTVLASPGDTTLTQLEARALEANLHQHPEWHELLHYQPRAFGRGYRSQGDDPAFFLSDEGETSPRAELLATLAGITRAGDGDDHARCRFPARDHWLRQQLDLPDEPAHCPALNKWLEELNTETVTLVFAASYLNSPSSMFGHTFIRLDPPRESKDTDLLMASTISYAADAEAGDSEIMFAYRGIFGGYPGVTMVEPYFEKINVYSEIENRDLYEYQLNLEPHEITQMLKHTWEIQDKHFDYYFFDQNCAYRLLALIDVARPGTELLSEVGTHAIPADTVRWVVDRGLVEDVHYRPSSATVISHNLAQLEPEERRLVLAIARGEQPLDGPAFATRSRQSQARILDVAFDYVRYATLAYGWPREQSAPLSHQLLVARSRLDSRSQLTSPPKPAVRDDQGHDTFRVSLGGGQQGDGGYTALSIRPAYHDLLDPPAGYRPGAELVFLGTDLRLDHDRDRLSLEQLTVIQIRSLTPRDAFFKPISWQVSTGLHRSRQNDGRRALVPYVNGGPGLGWSLGRWQATTLATASLEASSHLRNDVDAGPGAEFNLLRQGDRFSVNAGVRGTRWLVANRREQGEAFVGVQGHFRDQWGFRGELTREKFRTGYETAWSLQLNHYF